MIVNKLIYEPTYTRSILTLTQAKRASPDSKSKLEVLCNQLIESLNCLRAKFSQSKIGWGVSLAKTRSPNDANDTLTKYNNIPLRSQGSAPYVQRVCSANAIYFLFCSTLDNLLVLLEVFANGGRVDDVYACVAGESKVIRSRILALRAAPR